MPNLRLIVILLLAAAAVLNAQDRQVPIELVLKFDPLPDDALKSLAKYKGTFFLVLKGGEAFLAESEAPKAEADKHKGTLEFIHRSGIDPATRAFAPPIYQLRFRYVGSGWAEDKFITEMIVPYSLQKRGDKRVVVFSDRATEVHLWEVFRQGSIAFIGDTMDVRYERHTACREMSSNLDFFPR